MRAKAMRCQRVSGRNKLAKLAGLRKTVDMSQNSPPPSGRAGLCLGCLLLVCATLRLAAQPAQAVITFTGVNLAGAEFGTAGNGAALPGTFGTQYTYPNQDEVNYFRNKGLNLVRLGFRWERLQPAKNSTFNAAELNRLHTFVSQTTAKGVSVILNPHNFARYYPGTADFATMQSGSKGIIGSAEVPNSAFADFWSRLAAIYRTNSLVIFGLMNEPNAIPAAQWVSAANVAIAAIRATGATNLILVPGIEWTGAHNWSSSGNATAMLGIMDAANHHAFEVHQYLDGDSSGGSADIVNANIGVTRVAGFTQWLRTNHKRGFLGEFATANSTIGSGTGAIGDEALTNLLSYVQGNADVWLGWAWWAAGPWWGDYMFTLEPPDVGVANPTDRAAMSILKGFIPVPTPALAITDNNQFRFLTRAGFTYQPEASPKVNAGWTNLGPAITGNGLTASVDFSTVDGRGFYRVLVTRSP